MKFNLNQRVSTNGFFPQNIIVTISHATRASDLLLSILSLFREGAFDFFPNIQCPLAIFGKKETIRRFGYQRSRQWPGTSAGIDKSNSLVGTTQI